MDLERREQRVQSLVALFPVFAVADKPLDRRSEGIRLQVAEPGRRPPAARNEAGRLEHLQML
jgi:hypothetical protein